jgi:Spy/CpxP family protein refolding chaperone
MKRMSTLAFVMIMFFSVALAFAGPGGREMGPGTGMSPYAASNLGLTTEQTEKLQALQEVYLKEITPLQNQLFSKKAELRLLWSDANPSQEKILTKQSEINGLQQQLQEKATQYQLESRNILTPEQRAKAVNFGPGHGRGPGWKMGGRW